MTDAIQMLGKVYLVEGEVPTYDWKIQNDLKDISGHICMKAVTEDTVKGQKIVAWFAQDMPLSGGPERYCGLPGLILELDVNDGAMLISADLIEAKKLTTELDLPKKLKGKKITETEYQTIIKKHYEEKTKAEEPPFWGVRY
jgi:GLPGLI family protein